jgi:hypothetical protein
MQIKEKYQNIKLVKGGYLIDGNIYPRVSQFLSNLDKSALIQWSANKAVDYIDGELNRKFVLNHFEYRFNDDFKKQTLEYAKTAHRRIKEDAGDIGTLIHNAIECWLKNKDFKSMAKTRDDFNTISLAVENFKKWWTDNSFELVASEMPVGSIEYGFGGRIDILAKQRDKVVLIDLKTSKGIYHSHKVQCGAYGLALEEMYNYFLADENTFTKGVNKAIICHIPKTNPKVKAIPIEGDEFKASKDCFINLVDLHYNLEGIK